MIDPITSEDPTTSEDPITSEDPTTSEDPITSEDPTTSESSDRALDFKTLIPEVYKDKPYLKNIDSLDALFKQFDESQSLIGRKTVYDAPGEEASDAEKEAYLNRIGRPESSEAYSLESSYIDFLGEEVGTKFDTGIKNIFHKVGLTTKQAIELQKEYNTLMGEAQGKYGEVLKQQEEVKTKELSTTLGDKKEDIDAIIESVLEGTVSKERQVLINNNIDNKSKVILALAMEGVYDKFIKDDSIPKGNSTPSLTSINSVEQRLSEIIKNKAYTDEMDPTHKSIRNEAYELTKRKMKLQGRIK